MLTRTLTLSAVVSFAAAQLSLSDSCQQALTTIATSPDANACLVPTPLLPIVTNPNASIVDPVNQWLTQVCAAPACSNATLASIVSNVTSGCSAELQAFGVSSSDNSAVTTVVQQFYPTARKAVCLKDGNTNCVTQTLTNAQTVFGPLSITNIVKLAISGGNNITLPTNVTCTDCTKAFYNTVNADAPGFLDSESAQEQCGASFTDGTTPADISQSASDITQSNGTTPTQNGSAATRLSLGALSGASIVAALALLM